jgi:hypothetical protein
MVKEGYMLDGLTAKERERVWYSLAQRRRREQLCELLGLPDAEVTRLVAAVRRQRADLMAARQSPAPSAAPSAGGR